MQIVLGRMVGSKQPFLRVGRKTWTLEKRTALTSFPSVTCGAVATSLRWNGVTKHSVKY